jgi:predicted site-specific integrase-resolvase
MYSIGKFSVLIGKTQKTLRKWEKDGKLIPEYKTVGGHRMYSENQLNIILNKEDLPKINVGYARVSSKKQLDDLNRQTQLIETYLIIKNKPFKIITDVGSGINYKKPGLLSLIKMINDKEIDTVYILYKDRLVRFGYELVEYFCQINKVNIEIININDNKSDEEELIDDVLNIIHVFSCKINGRRSHINKKIIEKLNEQ